MIEKYSVQINAFLLVLGTILGLFGYTAIDPAEMGTLVIGLGTALVNAYNFVQIIRKTWLSQVNKK